MNHDFALRRDEDAGRFQGRMVKIFASRIVESVGDLAKNWNYGSDWQDAVFAFSSSPMVEFASRYGLNDIEKNIRLFVFGYSEKVRNILMDEFFRKLICILFQFKSVLSFEVGGDGPQKVIAVIAFSFADISIRYGFLYFVVFKKNGTSLDFLMYERVLYHRMLHFARWLHFLAEGGDCELADFVVKTCGMCECNGGDTAEIRKRQIIIEKRKFHGIKR